MRTVHYPIVAGELAAALPHLPAGDNRPACRPPDRAAIERSRELWDEISLPVKEILKQMAAELTSRLQEQLQARVKEAQSEEKARFKSRIGEVERAMGETTLQKLEKERDDLLRNMQQLSLFAEESRAQEERLRDLEEELNRRRRHYQGLLEQLQAERSRVIERILPKRYSLRASAQIFPITVEIRLPNPVDYPL